MKQDSFCVECGPHVRVDEDGCCASCGASAMGPWADKAAAAIVSNAELKRRIRLARKRLRLLPNSPLKDVMVDDLNLRRPLRRKKPWA